MTLTTTIVPKAPVRDKHESHAVARFAKKFSDDALNYIDVPVGRQEEPLSRAAYQFNAIDNWIQYDRSYAGGFKDATANFTLKFVDTGGLQYLLAEEIASNFSIYIDKDTFYFKDSGGTINASFSFQVGVWYEINIVITEVTITPNMVVTINGEKIFDAAITSGGAITGSFYAVGRDPVGLTSYLACTLASIDFQFKDFGNSVVEDFILPCQEDGGNQSYNKSGTAEHGAINGDLANFFTNDPTIPLLHDGNTMGYTIGVSQEIAPAISKTLDALGNRLTNPGPVRQLTRIKHVNVGMFDGVGKVKILANPDTSHDLPTIEFSIIIDAIGGGGSAVLWFGDTGFTYGGYIWIEPLSINVELFYDDGGGGGAFQYKLSSTFSLGVTYNISINIYESTAQAGMYDVDITINGFTSTADTPGTGRIPIQTNLGGADIYIGGDPFALEAIHGRLWDVRYYDDNGIQTTHWTLNEGTGITAFDLLNGRDGTWESHTNPSQWGKSDDAIDYFLQRGLKQYTASRLNGITSTVQIPYDASLQFSDGVGNDSEFAVTGWLKAEDITKTQSIISQGTTESYHIRVTNNTLRAQFILWTTNANYLILRTGNAAGNLDKNIFYYAYYDGSKTIGGMTIKTYDEDGNLLADGTIDNSNGTYTGMTGVTEDIHIGSTSTTTNVAAGLEWDIRVHSRALTDQEIQDIILKESIIGSEISKWRLDGEDFTDSVGTNDGTPTDVSQDVAYLEEINLQGRFFDTGSFLDFTYYNALPEGLPSNYSLGSPLSGPLYIQGNESLIDETPTSEATEVLARMSALNSNEERAITLFVNALVSYGYWNKIDEFFCFALNSTDWLTGFKDKTGLNTDAVRTDSGAEFNGTTAFINTQFNPSSYPVANFNGTTSKVLIPNNASLEFGDGAGGDLPFTYTAHIKTNDASPNTIIYNTDVLGFFIRLGSNDITFLIATDGGNYLGITTTSNPISSGSSYFVSCSYDASLLISGLSIKIYDEAAETYLTLTTSNTTFGTYAGLPANTGDHTIGINASDAQVFDGLIWDVQVHNEDLPAQDIENIRKGNILASVISRWRLDGSDFTDSVGSNDGTPTDVTQAFIADPVNQAYQLNDALAGVFLDTLISTESNVPFGSSEGINFLRVNNRTNLDQVRNHINSDDYLQIGGGGIGSGDLGIMIRTASNSNAWVVNGSQLGSGAAVSTSIPKFDVYVGAYNDDGVATFSFEGTISSFIIGSAIGIDQSVLFQLHEQFLKDLGVIDTPAISTEEEDFIVTQDFLVNDDLLRVNNFTKSGFSQLPVRLTHEELFALDKFKRAENIVGNWEKYDAIWVFGLISGVNALFDIKNFRQAVNNGAVKVREGFEFNGVDQFINSKFNPFTDAVNNQDLDSNYNAFLSTIDTVDVGDKSFIGGSDGSNIYFFIWNQSGNRTRSRHYTTSGQSYTDIVPENDQLASNPWDGVNNKLFFDGVEAFSRTGTFAGKPNIELYIGGHNNNGSPISYYKGKLASISITSKTGFSLLAHNDNLRVLLGELAAAHVINEMPASLTQREKDAITTFVREEFVAGNYQKYDYFVCFALATEANALKDWKQGLVATNAGATKVAEGYKFGAGLGVNVFDASVDGVNYTLDDALVGFYIYDNTETVVNNNDILQSVSQVVRIRWQVLNFRKRGRLHSTGDSNFFSSVDNLDLPQTYARARTSSTDVTDYKDGAAINTAIQTSTVMPDIMLFRGPSGGTGFTTISTFVAGSAIGFDHVAHNTNIRNLLNELLFQEEIDDVLSKFPNPLSTQEEAAIGNFIKREILANNWDKYDYFTCYALVDEANALTSWVGDFTAINNGATKVVEGFDFVSDSINTNYNPSIGKNWSLDDALVGVYVFSTDNAGRVISNNPGSDIQIRQGVWRVNTTGSSSGSNSIAAMALNVAERTASNNTNFYIDGVIDRGSLRASEAVTDNNIIIGGFSGNYTTGIVSTFIAGGAVGFDQLAHYNNLIELLVELGALVRFDFLPNPVSLKEAATIQKFIDDETTAGNYGLMDSFACFALSDDTNKLADWVREGVNYSLGAGLTKEPEGIFSPSGSEGILTAYNPTDDAVNYGDEDAQASVFIIENGNLVDDNEVSVIFGDVSTTKFIDTGVSSDRVTLRFHSSTISTVSNKRMQPGSLWSAIRDTGNARIREDGVSLKVESQPFASIPNGDYQVVLPGNSGIAAFSIGAGIGFDYAAHTTNLLTMLISLLPDNTEIDGIIDSFPNAILLREEYLLRRFIQKETDAGNWALTGGFACFALSDSANALWDMKRQVSLLNTGLATKIATGFSFNGTSNWIDTLYNPSTESTWGQIAATTAVWMDSFVSFQNQYVFGVHVGGTFVALQEQPDTPRLRSSVNGATGMKNHSGQILINNSWQGISREQEIKSLRYQNGEFINAPNDGSASPPNANIAVGALNNDGTKQNYFEGVLSCWIAGYYADRVESYLNVRNLMSGLGLQVT